MRVNRTTLPLLGLCARAHKLQRELFFVFFFFVSFQYVRFGSTVDPVMLLTIP